MQRVLILSWQIGQDVFETQMFLTLGYLITYKLTFTALKIYFQKQNPKVIKNRNYKKLITICLEMVFWTNYCNETFNQNVLRLMLRMYLIGLLLKPGPGPWTRTLKIWTQKNLDPHNLDPEELG